MASRAERRRREKESQKAAAQGRAAPERVRRRNRIVAAALAVGLAGAVAFVFLGDEDRDCPGHWHATFAIYVDGERVRFPQPPYSWDGEGGKLPLSLHMHAPDDEQLHFEPRSPRCVGVQSALELLDVRIAPGELALSGAHEGGPHGDAYRDEGNRTLRVFLEPRDGTLQEAPVAGILGHQLRDGEKMLVAFGSYTPDQVRAMMDAIRDPAG
jgi:hypothetical protein